MKTHIFIGSTFFDMKYRQEDLSSFVKIHDFEPIIFEDGGLAHMPGREPDAGRYEAMKLADMVILIIGGSYGSIMDNSSENGYITGKEFKTSIEEGVPVYAFIDQQVYSEYGVYEVNTDSIDQDESLIKFRATKDVNVFRFINEIKSVNNISINEFNRLEDIKDFLSAEWSSMFKIYLRSLRNDKPAFQMDESMSKFNSLISEMNTMIGNTEKRLLAAKTELETVNNKDEIIKPEIHIEKNPLELLCDTMASSIIIKHNDLDDAMKVDILVDELAGYYSRNRLKISKDYQKNGISREELENEFLVPLFSKGLSVLEAKDSLFTDLDLSKTLQMRGAQNKIKQVLLSDDKLFQQIFR